MGIRLLGPVELRTAAGGLVVLPGSQRRAVLALLALRQGRVVAVDQFFELLWGEEPPARAKAALQGHVAALRKVLAGTPFTLHTRMPGYQLSGPAEQVDALRFEALAALAGERAAGAQQDQQADTASAGGAAAAARAGDEDRQGEAIGLLEQALSLWQGAALADLPDTELRRALASRLDEARTKVLITWAELRLRRGTGAVAVPALEQSVRADGLREAVVALLVRCLHQAGRSPDALTVYHHARALLNRELGLLPGPELRAALSEVLSEEPTWSAGRTGGPPGARTGGSRWMGTSVVGAAPGPGAATGQVTAQAQGHPDTAGHDETGERTGGWTGERTGERTGGWTGGWTGERAGAPGRPLPRELPAAAPAPDTVEPPAPRQLPRQPAGFVGRAQESRRLDRECGPDRTGDGLALVVGPAGAGKSATVIRWAHQVAAGFPDGQLFVDLRGFDPARSADPAEVLGRFLLALGVPESAVPEDRSGRAALYRTRTEGRRLLVVLDNAADAEQVAELLPGGQDCAAVITSRSTLEALVVTEGAALIRLEALPDGDALRLLERGLTPARVRAEAAAAQQLAGLCDHLPLALRIAASRLAARPDWAIADLVAELADERTRLLALETQGAVSIRTTLALTYRHLSPDAAGLLTVLAAHPGPEVDAPAGAALLGTDPATAGGALAELAAHHLLTEGSPGRYSRHDLIRLFGVELFGEQPAEVQRLSVERLLDYYLEAARHCAEQLEPGQDGHGERAHRPPALPNAVDARSALAWFRDEEPTVRALVTAAGTADPERAWRLALLSSPLYYGSSLLTDWLSCLRAGESAAARCGDRIATALLRGTLASALTGLERREESVGTARRAVADTSPEDGFAHVRALVSLALGTAIMGDPVEATRLTSTAVALAETAGDRRRLCYALGHAAAVSLMAGDLEDAVRQAREARSLLPDRPTAIVHAWSLLTEAQALHALGSAEAAEPLWSRLLATCREAGFLHLHAIAEQSYAGFLLSQGREPEAVEHLRSAVGLYRLHCHLAGAVSELLAVIEDSLSCRAGFSPAAGEQSQAF
ncbi:winged helix-turn-helix domain-containing protein [Kitasatospora sp. NBC_01287]|uniref:AfsR/SARP family transcriptional regulator n=1 Tax=Kitasatospora sp. NBC_01287 TaxID=2903573 RepID=UPI00225018B3|nr:BTAD domain-containing putative transcriptional regulator [Kitasatospora sp. NBC_01287]MCX4745820.1 winged helix-turn-helix domain-containing protein [Kitasatospora sp. NBC_01287]